MKDWDTVKQYESATLKEKNNYKVIYNERF